MSVKDLRGGRNVEVGLKASEVVVHTESGRRDDGGVCVDLETTTTTWRANQAVDDFAKRWRNRSDR
jgi:hypothetical protein